MNHPSTPPAPANPHGLCTNYVGAGAEASQSSTFCRATAANVFSRLQVGLVRPGLANPKKSQMFGKIVVNP
jgi:hypothetical protein